MKLRTMTLFVALVIAVMTCSVPALADQLALGGDGILTFTGLATGFQVTTNTCAVANPSPSCVGSGSSGSYEQPTGNVVFSGASWYFTIPSMPPLLAMGPLNAAGNYPVISGNPSTFKFAGTGAHSGDTVEGSIKWAAVVPGTIPGHNLAVFAGFLTVTNSTGLLVQDFPASATVPIDYTFDLGATNTLAILAGHPDITFSARASSGEVPGVPEPTSILFLGTGMLVAGTVIRMKRRKA